MSYVKHKFYLKILAPQKDEANWTDKASFKILLKKGILSFIIFDKSFFSFISIPIFALRFR